MPRFVLLYHDCPPDFARTSHWDLMLELGDSLATWAMMELPGRWIDARARTAERCPDCATVVASDNVAAERLSDHRVAYLDYEGPVSGDRGNVTRIASGEYELLARDAAHWEIDLREGLPSGKISLRRDSSADSTAWILSCGN
jgi:hypothetical protein